jgi:hypothetical protein
MPHKLNYGAIGFLLGMILALILIIPLIDAQLPNTSLSNGSGAPSGSCISGSSYTDSSTGFVWSCKSGTWLLTATTGVLSCTTSSVGGSLLAIGGTTTGTATCTGAAAGQPCEASASDGTNMAALGLIVHCDVTSSNTATVTLYAIIALTPVSKTYNVRVIP